MFDTPEHKERAPFGPVASLGLHAGLIALLALLSLRGPVLVTPPRSITVEIVSPAALARALAPPVLRAPAPRPSAAQSAAEGDGMIAATQMQAASVLAQSRQVREALPLLAPEERMTQLCAIEAIEQINGWNPDLSADVLVAYAFAETLADGLTLRAPDGAFRSRRSWYHIGFDCTVAADFSAVTKFRFKPGAEVPRNEWEAHDLTAEEIE